MKNGKKRFLFIMVFLFSFLIALLLLPGVALAEDWTQDATGGFGFVTNDNALSMAEYNGRLYVGTGSLPASCEVWAYDGLNWTSLIGATPGSLLPPGFGNPNNKFAWSMAVYNGELFVGTGNTNGCEVWSYNGNAWTELVGPGPGALIGSGFGNANNDDAFTMAVYGGVLYVGTGNVTTACEVWSFNGTAWTQLVGAQPSAIIGPGFGNPANTGCQSLAGYAGELYAGTDNTATSCELWSLGVAGWTQVVGGLPGAIIGPGFGNPANTTAQSLIVFSNHLYVGTQKGWGGGCEVWRYDGTAWVMLVGGAGVNPNSEGFGNINNGSAWSAAVYDLSLYWGTLNTATGCEIWSTKTAPSWFLAEGATQGGFETWVLVQNPNPAPVNIDIDYMTSTGLVQGPMVAIPGQSRMSFPVNATVTDFDVSTQVTSTGGDVICERAVYWNLDGGIRVLGHDSIGVPTSSMTWFLAEGATEGGFETWVLVQNPNPNPVDIDIDYMTSTGPVQGPLDTVQGQSRKSYRVNNDVTDFDVSTQVTSLTPGGEIICERAMYWIPDGGTQRVLGHDSKGATTAGSTWFLAEGATAGGFETWVLVQNPNPQAVNIDIKFQTELGQVQGPVDTIFAQSRKSYLVNAWVDTFDVSTRVDSFGGDVICERAMYWTPPGVTQRALGHDSIGVRNNGGLTWYLAEGATEGGFETWVLVQNPNPAPVTIDMRFQTGLGQVQGPIDTIPAESRRSYNVNAWVNTFDVSTQVDSTAGGLIICERAMYWSALPGLDWILGHDSIGFDP